MAQTAFRLSKKEQEAQLSVYNHLESMIKERNRTWPNFNGPDGNRTLIQYTDDNDRRIIGFRPTKEEQGKEEWQSNIFDNVTRVKLKAFCAGIALQIPEQVFKAVNEKGLYSAQRAEMMYQLVRFSRMKEDNPALQTFFEAWDMLAKGTVIKFDGYRKIKHPRKIITGQDPQTGEVTWKEEEVISEDRCVDIQVPIAEFFIWDFHIFDVQLQPRVAWVQHYNKDDLETEFGQFKNFKYVKDAQNCEKFQTTTVTHFLDKWVNRVEKQNDYEVIRYFSIAEDRYEIWCNGIPFLQAPMLWGKKRKRYPFSKSIREPFTGKEFFYGMALPHELEGHQDMKNTTWNTTLDKALRSLLPPMLVGMANKDLLDLEDEYVNQDNKIYVPDVSQVKPMPYEGVSNGDINIINMIQRALDLQSTDANQSGVTGKGVTAREIVVADENARKLKGITYMFLEDLHIQKTRNRITTILMNYTLPKMEAVIGTDGKKQMAETFKVFNVENAKFSDGTTGTLGIHMISNPQKLPSITDVEATEAAMEAQGINYKMIGATYDYLDDYDYDFVVVPESLFAQDKVKKEAVFNEKLDRMATYFPEYIATNKEMLFSDFVSIYGDNAEKYQQPVPPQPETPPEDGSLLGL